MMRLRWLPILVAACVALAGCSASGDAAGAQKKDRLPDGVQVETAPGVVTGVVVDAAIRPLEGATVTLQGDAFNGTATTDLQGVFRFQDVPPGTYILSGEHRLYKKAQMAIEVKKAVETPVARLVLEATFSQTPYSLAFKFDGILNCGYEAVIISAPCVTDYTSILPTCPGGCAPDLRRVQGL
ncbi:MAG TPA: carboxypeptidase-like regulatory domain-containing protein, partial [Candidatus Thermoplasmatota archaeon]|nr:carboxypeptidase-like regulatory domain-containing protein [Candidatus Thermoplasmatota archaeon]